MSSTYSKNIKTWFTGTKKSTTYPKSIKHVDSSGVLHGEQREWWDRNHLFPKELSVYDHGALVRSTRWYLNGHLQSSIVVIGRTKKEMGFYPSGTQKYKKTYRLISKEWVRHDHWCGFYRNGLKHYVEKYNFGTLITQIRFFSNGNMISKYSIDDKEEDSSDSSSISSIDTEDGSFELTEKIFEENEYDLDNKLVYKDI